MHLQRHFALALLACTALAACGQDAPATGSPVVVDPCTTGSRCKAAGRCEGKAIDGCK